MGCRKVGMGDKLPKQVHASVFRVSWSFYTAVLNHCNDRSKG